MIVLVKVGLSSAKEGVVRSTRSMIQLGDECVELFTCFSETTPTSNSALASCTKVTFLKECKTKLP